MERLPLLPGPSTPDFVEKILDIFGDNPHREPMYRLIWSERKQILFAGEVAPEYLYLDRPSWILETWTDPIKDAGFESDWDSMKEFLLGAYPRHGTYNLVQQMPVDWQPSEETVRVLAKGVQESKHLEIAAREKAIRENLEAKKATETAKVAEAIVELQDSASMGKIQQSVSGPKNTFRTPDDFGRDRERREVALPGLPKRGGKLLQ